MKFTVSGLLTGPLRAIEIVPKSGPSSLALASGVEALIVGLIRN